MAENNVGLPPYRGKDLSGQRFGRLVVLHLDPHKTGEHGRRLWACRCNCDGSICLRLPKDLTSGRVLSCGCLRKECARKINFKHGGSRVGQRHPLYVIWTSIKYRCYNPSCSDFHNYGGRGIRVCDRWLHSFPAFFDDMNDGYKPGLTIERINTNKDYEPENCRWATQQEQCNNMRKNQRIFAYGKIQTLSEWSRELGIVPSKLFYRLRNGFSIEDVLTTKSLKKRNERGQFY